MQARRGLITVAAALALAAAMSACGSSKPKTTASPSSSFEGRGPITLAGGKDTSGVLQQQLDKWNTDHPTEKVSLVELPESADAQRQQLIQNAQTKSSAYTLEELDVVWTAEFAANGWVEQLPETQFNVSQMIKPAVDTGKYFNKLYAVPYNSNAGLLFYRKDLLDAAGVTAAPKTWADLQSACTKVQATTQGKGVGCYAGQLDKYEGLTVNFSEAVDSAGGAVVGSDGKASVNTPEAKKGLDFLVDGFKSGMIPKDAITYKEEDARRAFQDGKLIFERQWPYMYDKANVTDGSSKVNGKFGIAPLPGLNGLGKSTLGGYNIAISKYATNKATAADFLKWFTNADNAKSNLQVASLPPVYASLYDDSSLQQKYGYLSTLKDAINNAQGRPELVHYGDGTAAIQEEAYNAITGKKTSDQALKDMQTKLDTIIATR